ncbi:hypothetical protein FOZ62_025457 [Perkinsus olseni]|uniref:Peptidase A1 domain-containing protein n=1 Tax=Perkinsus olseni TaxID=32597 RepID=A0A7J6RBP4_PEROL|nr:hypothetical protein FOZ62_025457 [Perkinsus olseni]
MRHRKILPLAAPLQGRCFVKLPVFYEDGHFRTEVTISSQKVHLLVDTGSVSFHVVARNYFKDSCGPHLKNCYKLSPATKRALENSKEEGSYTKTYHRLVYDMRPMNGTIQLTGHAKPYKTEMSFHVVVRAWTREDQVEEGAKPAAILGLGPPRQGANSFLDQLVEHGIIKDEERVFTLMLPPSNTENGELIIGNRQRRNASDLGALLHLPIYQRTPQHKRRWEVVLASISVVSATYVRTEQAALLDSGCPFIFGPPNRVEELISSVIEQARLKKGEGVVKWSTSGYYWLKCDDAKYLPDLHLDFAAERSGADSVPLFRGRDVHFDFRTGKLGLTLSREKTSDKDLWAFEQTLQPGLEAIFV